MNTTLVQRLPLLVAFSTTLLGCAAQYQTSMEVTTREPGERFLGAPQPAQPEAAKDLQFAWLAEAAYGNTPGGHEQKKADEQDSENGVSAPPSEGETLAGDANCPVSQSALKAAGWTVWPDFPNDGLLSRIGKYHLRVEVWFHRDPAAVAVAFGGTVFNSHNDWVSNLRWFLPADVDEYSETVREFAPAFIAEYRSKLQSSNPDWAFLRQAKLYSTGHSLGGGLAQQFAYALPKDDLVPRVDHVYAFDPSPVTGYFSVEKGLREANSQNLLIDRIYERGEILAIVRSLTSVLVQPSASMPTIRGVRFNLFKSNPIAGHSMTKLTCMLLAASHESPTQQITSLSVKP